MLVLSRRPNERLVFPGLDVVLLDMVLPRCDGPTTVREIRRDPASDDLPIFALTGHAPDRFRLDGRVDGWLQKPLNPEERLARLTQEAAATP